MATAEADLAALLAQQKAQEKLLEQLIKPKDTEFLIESLSHTITQSAYDPQQGVVFDKWYARYEEVFTKGGAKLEEVDRVRLLLQKLNTVDHDRYVNYILPKNPREVTFADTISTLKEMFGYQSSMFFRRYKCLQTSKRSSEDFVTYASTVNKACEDFSVNAITPDQFKCLVFVAGLHSEKDKDIRTRLLAKMESETEADPMTLKKLLLECQHLDNLKHDTAVIENPKHDSKTVNAVRSTEIDNSKDKTEPSVSTPRRPCWQCGHMHFVADCPYSSHTCRSCGKVGHKEGYCGCFSKSQSSTSAGTSKSPGAGGKKKDKKEKAYHQGHSKGVFTINMRDSNDRRKYVEVLINDKTIELQLDCGSDCTIVSVDSLATLGDPDVRPTDLKVPTAAGKPLHLVSEFQCNVTFLGMMKQSVCYVTSVSGFNVLGSDLMQMFGLYDMPINSFCKQLTAVGEPKACEDQLKAKFPEVFRVGLGLCTKTKIQLYLQPGAKPVFKPKRPVPFHQPGSFLTDNGSFP